MYNQEQFLANKFANFLQSWGEFHYVYKEAEISDECMQHVLEEFNKDLVEFVLEKEEDGQRTITGRIKPVKGKQ